MRSNPRRRTLAGPAWACLLLLLPAPVLTAPALDRASGCPDTSGAAAGPSTAGGLQAAALLSAESGWVLAGGRLFLTADAGDTWLDITPPHAEPFSVAAASFVDPRIGFAVLSAPGEDGLSQFALARTVDGGAAWQTQPLALFLPGDVGALLGEVHLQFLDSQTGWLTVIRATSSNFRLGSLFATGDGGRTWQRLPLPVGEPAWFVSDQVGFVAGGALGDEFYRTEDGGASWVRMELGMEPAPGSVLLGTTQRFYQLPDLVNPSDGVIAVTVRHPGGAAVEFYATADGGASWQVAAWLRLQGEVSDGVPVPLVALSGDRWLAILPDSHALLEFAQGGLRVTTLSQDPVLTGIRWLDMATPRKGWAYSEVGRCDPLCHQDAGLLRTSDGGRTWEPVRLPLALGGLPAPGLAQSLHPGARPLPASGATGIDWVVLFEGHGFDKCEIPSLSQLQTWRSESPYQVLNLYIGGVSRGCPNLGLDAEYVQKAHRQGWRFIPTWVGPQAACSAFAHRMSLDPAAAYAEGYAEASAALAAAQALGLAEPDGAGTIIYYDLEAYPYNDLPCRAAASAFIDGWTAGLWDHGSVAGAYGAGCASAPSDWANLDHVPDAVWLAHWIRSYFDPDASVWGVACVPDGLWVNHQRLRQYTGGHNETWGGITLRIDCDVLDGPVSFLGPRCGDPDPCWYFHLPLTMR